MTSIWLTLQRERRSGSMTKMEMSTLLRSVFEGLLFRLSIVSLMRGAVLVTETVAPGGCRCLSQPALRLVSGQLDRRVEIAPTAAAAELVRARGRLATGNRMPGIISKCAVDGPGARSRAEFRPRSSQLLCGRMLAGLIRSLKTLDIGTG